MSGWTGGQYSLYRMVLGAGVGSCFALHPAEPLAWIAIALAVPLAVGRFDRFAAGALAGLCLFFRMPCEVLLLVLHVAAPPAPYGSWEAAGRADPDGGWQLAEWIPMAARLGVVGAWVHAIFVGPILAGPGFVLVHVLALDPAWIPRRRDASPATVFYDGHCGLCHGSVRFLLAEDRDGAAFRYAPLESSAFASCFGAESRAELPDSVLLALPDGTSAVRSAAFAEIGARLGGFWRLGGALLTWVPTRVADGVYDFIAARRARLFGRTEESCPRIPPELSERFLT